MELSLCSTLCYSQIRIYYVYKCVARMHVLGNTRHDWGVHGVGVDYMEAQTKMGRLQGAE